MSNPTAEKIDTANKFMIGVRGDRVNILNPPTRLTELSADEAMLLAAYLVAVIEHKATHSFQDVLEAVCGS